MSSIEVTIDRDCIYMGVDVQSHEKTYVIPSDATYKELFKEIYKDSDLPSLSGNNVV